MQRYRIIILNYPTETIIGEFNSQDEMQEALRPYLYNPDLRLDFWFNERWVRGWTHSQYPTS